MQTIITRISHPHAGAVENTTKPIAEVENAIRDFVRRDGDPSNLNDSSDTAANVNSLVQRGTSLSELQTVIQELEELYDFLHSEGERLERQISEFAQLRKSTTSTTRLIADKMFHSKKPGVNKL